MKIALDVDGVLSDFNTALIKRAGETDYKDYMPKSVDEIKTWGYCQYPLPQDDEFWLGIEPYKEALKYCPKPVAYITHRPVSSGVTEQWLKKHKFPKAPVITVDKTGSKLGILRALASPVFVDDKQETVEEINDGGVLCYCLDRGWNQGLKKGYPRIKSLEELQWLVTSR